MLAPFLSLYTTSNNRAMVFSGALYMNVAGTILGTAQYFAAFISPYIIKRIGQVKTLGWLCIASIPFMFILDNGNSLGKSTTIIFQGKLGFLHNI